ncbi:hypothetical protein TD95_003005 [Thielaviopsis punctulata]|uniref:Uncharacterized protein n=1 Tax=Thielaviopsis punctulata TaxID=72032 RepID=A0A0F4ZEI3_9PEZI|nr:hypothetical protein TD95_003005 [Thielaviopsis punctulata]
MAAPNIANESAETRTSATSSSETQTQEPGYNSHPSQSSASAADAGIINTISEDAQKHPAVSAAKLVSTGSSLSEGSDSEAVKQDGKPQNKSTTIKKPATFKAVSVNKTFLAAKGPASAPQLKVNDKSVSSSAASTPPTTSTLPAGKPRLIAKTGGNGSMPKFSSAINGRPPTSEPSGVWNKNRPAAPATPPVDPSKITDEDLKKDGIHVASRLQTDDSRTSQSNWADIEDDDDDWASETIEWTDGTKTTLPHMDETQPSPIPRSATPPKATPPTSKPAPTTATTSLGSGRPGLILRGSGDRPSLVAKVPPPAAPTKSPWAPLPSIDKVSPAAPYMPTPHQSQQRHNSYQNQNHGYSNNHNNIPHDSYPRNLDPPLDRRSDYGHQGMMQRPRQNSFNDHNNASGYPPRQISNDGPYTRDRRGSMNMGYGPGRFHQMNGPSNYHNMPYNNNAGYGPRRPSFNDGPPPISPRGNGTRPTTVALLVLMVLLAPMAFTVRMALMDHMGPMALMAIIWPLIKDPQGLMGFMDLMDRLLVPWTAPLVARTRTVLKRMPTQWNSPQSQRTSHASPVIPEEDTAEFQKKLMRERAEEAMRRRQEQEAREEAAKQERLRRKLEALGPAPERQSTKKQTPVVSKAQTETFESVDKVPIPEAILARKDAKPEASSPVPPASQPMGQAGSNSRPLSSGQASPHAQKQPKIWESSGPATHVQSAGPPPSRGMGSGWGAGGSVVHPPRNVWGAPNNDRGLGNGTFIADMSTIPGSGPVHNGPAPIGPPGSSRPSDTQSYESHSRQKSVTSETERRPAWSTHMHQGDSAAYQGEKKQVDIDMSPALLKSTWRNTSEPEANRDFQAVSSSGSVQPRPSRFFPTRDSRPMPEQHSAMAYDPIEVRVRSPSPPPPISEDHPVYDGDLSQPNVLLPKPHPIVRLPPTLGSSQSYSSQSPPQTASSSSGHWQSKINNLLSGHKPQPRRNSVDSTSPSTQFSRPVSRGVASHPASTASQPQTFEATTMPMSTDCFEEPEMGSLPRICLPKEVPEAAWTAAAPQMKPLPRRFAILNNTSSTEPDFYDPSGQIRIHMIGMAEAKFIYHASVCRPRTQSRGSGGQGRSRRGNGSKSARSENKQQQQQQQQSAVASNATLAPPPSATTSSRSPTKQPSTRSGSRGPSSSNQQQQPRQPAEGQSGSNNGTPSENTSSSHKGDTTKERERGEHRNRRDSHAPRGRETSGTTGTSSGSRGGYRGRGSEWGRRGGSVSNRGSYQSQTTA